MRWSRGRSIMVRAPRVLPLSVAVLAIGIGAFGVIAWLRESGARRAAQRWPTLGISVENDVPDLSNVSIRFSRSTCMGYCPSYEVTIRGDGTGTFEGLAYVKRTGTVRFQVARDDMERLLDAIDAAHFMSFEHRCMWLPTDTPRLVLTVTWGDRVHSYTDRSGGDDWSKVDPRPGEAEAHAMLNTLHGAIDAACGIEALIGTEDERRVLFSGTNGR